MAMAMENPAGKTAIRRRTDSKVPAPYKRRQKTKKTVPGTVPDAVFSTIKKESVNSNTGAPGNLSRAMLTFEDVLFTINPTVRFLPGGEKGRKARLWRRCAGKHI